MRRMTVVAQKKSKELPSKILAQKGVNLTRNGRQGYNVAHLLPQSLSPPRRKKREIRSKTKRGEVQDPQVRLRIHCHLIPRVLRVR